MKAIRITLAIIVIAAAAFTIPMVANASSSDNGTVSELNPQIVAPGSCGMNARFGGAD